MGKTKEIFMQETEAKLDHLFSSVIRQYYEGEIELEPYMDTLKHMDDDQENND